jgi:hypothetical protein
VVLGQISKDVERVLPGSRDHLFNLTACIYALR